MSARGTSTEDRGNPAPATPQYLRIARALRARMQSGELQPGTPLPSQQRMSAEYGVTLMTLRQAIELLKRDGLVETRHGVGTFVAPRRFSYRVDELRSFAQEVAALGLRLTTEIVASEFAPAEALEAAELEIEVGDEILHLKRLRYVEGDPVVYQESYLPAWIGRQVAHMDLRHRALYDVLAEDLGFAIRRARERIRPVVLGPDIAERLAQAHGAPAVVSERVSLDAEDRHLVYDRAYMPGDRVAILAEREAGDMALRYELRRERAATATASR